MAPPRVVLKPRKARPFFARHPWVYAGSIAREEGRPAPGDEVAVVSHEGLFVARGLYNPHSALRVRLYRWEDEALDPAFWRDRVESAARLRDLLAGYSGPGTACRLVYSEADGLSGLTVDRYARWLAVQFTSLALHARREAILAALADVVGPEGMVVRFDRAMAGLEGLADAPTEVVGSVPDGPAAIVENGLAFEVDLRGGQKTGFYLDQRENRRAVAAYAGGRPVLDLFCYAGGFALAASKLGGAEHVTAFDSSGPAIEAARRNAVANGSGAVRFEQADVFDALEAIRSAGRRFGLVVCDPPKFARNSRDLEDALRKYVHLNRAAVDAVEPGGLLATCSCSGLVDRVMFTDVLARVAELSGRPIQILEARGQAPDHPISASCQETDYLKCFVCRVG